MKRFGPAPYAFDKGFVTVILPDLALSQRCKLPILAAKLRDHLDAEKQQPLSEQRDPTHTWNPRADIAASQGELSCKGPDILTTPS